MGAASQVWIYTTQGSGMASTMCQALHGKPGAPNQGREHRQQAVATSNQMHEAACRRMSALYAHMPACPLQASPPAP